ncbi:MAG TPA: ribonuclease J [Geodermatophilus sp.]|nr:ribonuclease J [Geodermatophilus sp.]
MTTSTTQPHLDLQAPPALPAGGLRVMALGGLGEIGRNMAVLEFDGKLLVIDCGVLFPEAEQPGVDLILPDFGVIEHRLDDVIAVVLTHGHEDHIGAIPYLLRMRGDIPLVGSRFTLALVKAKLREHRLDPVLVEVAANDDHVAGPFHCEFISVNHSIPDALAVAVHTPAGVLVHTGDFKMDQLPLDGVLTDLGAFARLGLEGIDLLLADSTNAEIPGFVTPERSIGPVLEDVFRRATQRLIVSSFASHVHRIQQVLDAAEMHGRKVALVGRSMVRSEVTNPGISALVESASSRSMPPTPSRANAPRSVSTPSSGSWSILKSPVCTTTPAGVCTATASASGIEWLTEMNSQWNGPTRWSSPAATSTSVGSMRCSRSLAATSARVNRDPTRGMSPRSRSR